jgi:hypothetical protein
VLNKALRIWRVVGLSRPGRSLTGQLLEAWPSPSLVQKGDWRPALSTMCADVLFWPSFSSIPFSCAILTKVDEEARPSLVAFRSIVPSPDVPFPSDILVCFFWRIVPGHCMEIKQPRASETRNGSISQCFHSLLHLLMPPRCCVRLWASTRNFGEDS